MFTTILAYPLLSGVKLRSKPANMPITGRLSEVYTRQSLTFLDKYNMAGFFTAKFDTNTGKYVYNLQLKEPLNEEIQFKRVQIDNEQINFFTDNQVMCINCQKVSTEPNRLIFPAGHGVDLTITNYQLIKVIKFTEPDDKITEFVFWQ
jgi:hypothetical protein